MDAETCSMVAYKVLMEVLDELEKIRPGAAKDIVDRAYAGQKRLVDLGLISPEQARPCLDELGRLASGYRCDVDPGS
jgi:hypothetical protein